MWLGLDQARSKGPWQPRRPAGGEELGLAWWMEALEGLQQSLGFGV